MLTPEEMRRLLNEQDSTAWSNHRLRHPSWKPDLSGWDLTTLNLAPLGKLTFDLSGANLCGTLFPPAWERVSGANGPMGIKNARFDIHTRFPANFDPLAHGAHFVSEDELATHARAEAVSVFISYAWADDDQVLAIDRRLRARGFDTRLDRRDFFAGEDLDAAILRVMSGCDVVLIFYSARSRDRTWTTFERELARDLGTGGELAEKRPRIIYVVLDDTPLPGVAERHRIAVFAKGKEPARVGDEIYRSMLRVPG